MKKLIAFLLIIAIMTPIGAIASPGGIRFSIDGNTTNPGEAVVIRIANVPKDAVVEAESDLPVKPMFFREPKKASQETGDMVGILPVSYNVAPGEYFITLRCAGKTKQYKITAGEKEFSVQHLTVPQETAEQTILNQKADAEYEQYIAPVRRESDNKRHWSGRFIWPLKEQSRVTTTFGAIRYTNGGKTPSRHGAIDFAASQGTPVYASGAGRVAYAGYLQLTGYTIVIEHGYGLKTWHYHMESVDVEKGDMVEQGQKIGAVGSTGFSTGPHLHFGMSVSNLNGHVFINPETAISTDLFVSIEDKPE